MPPGGKKKKSSKRRNHKMAVNNHHDQERKDSPKSPTSLPPLIPPQGKGKEKWPVVIEDEGEETFETPRFQPETPYYSMENMKNGRRDEIEGSSEVNVPVDKNFKGLVEESPKEMKLDESVHVAEEETSIGKDLTLEKLETEEDVQPIDKSDGERTPAPSIEAADASSSNEKEVKVVPWLDEEVPSINGDVNGDVEVVHSEERGDADGKRSLEREFEKDEGLKDTQLENLGEDKKQLVPINENSKDVVESAQEMLPQIDVDLTNNELDQYGEKSSLLVENSVLITEQASQDSKALRENPESSVSTRVKEAVTPSPDAEKSAIAQRNEVARGPPVVRHATLWNCCGLLEVFTSSDR